MRHLIESTNPGSNFSETHESSSFHELDFWIQSFRQGSTPLGSVTTIMKNNLPDIVLLRNHGLDLLTMFISSGSPIEYRLHTVKAFNKLIPIVLPSYAPVCVYAASPTIKFSEFSPEQMRLFGTVMSTSFTTMDFTSSKFLFNSIFPEQPVILTGVYPAEDPIIRPSVINIRIEL